MAAKAFEHVPNTVVFNIGGQPAASLPLWRTSDGLPVGVQIAAKRGAEDVLLALAAQLDAVRQWDGRVPPAV